MSKMTKKMSKIPKAATASPQPEIHTFGFRYGIRCIEASRPCN